MKIYLTPGKKIKGREYCHSCGTDITIIKSHDCLNGWAFGTVLPIKIGDLIKHV